MNDTYLKPCPWCGSLPTPIIKILSEDGVTRTGQCEVTMKCVNEECPIKPAGETFGMLEGENLNEATAKAKQAWNTRFKPATPFGLKGVKMIVSDDKVFYASGNEAKKVESDLLMAVNGPMLAPGILVKRIIQTLAENGIHIVVPNEKD